jgi:transcriptional regulator with XRE-family HTH domain
VVATRANALGDYLRARREQLRPDDVGLLPGARRRVPGLRREEVATLAGISSAYYLRLEQGRDTHPSGQVVEALAQALRLDRKATEYLQQLARSTGSRPRQSTVQTVTQRLRQLIDQIPFPAMVCNRYLDVLAANAYARALTPGATPGRNRMCSVFLDPAARERFVNWDELTDIAVCEFREAAGDLDDPRVRARHLATSGGRSTWPAGGIGRGGTCVNAHPRPSTRDAPLGSRRRGDGEARTVDPAWDGPPRPGHRSPRQLNSYRSHRARAGFRKPNLRPPLCAAPTAQFRHFAVLVVAWTMSDVAYRCRRSGDAGQGERDVLKSV